MANELKKMIKELKNGDYVSGCFLLRKKEIAKTKNDKPYFKLELVDKTGSLAGRLWEYSKEVDNEIDSGDIVFIRASVDEWRGSLQFKLDSISKAHEGEYDVSDMIRAVDDAEEIFLSLRSLLRKNITDKWAAILIESFFEDNNLQILLRVHQVLEVGTMPMLVDC